MERPRRGPVEYALVGIFAGGWFLDFTWFREQFCNFLCPYARFQSALVDDQTLMITYDAARGEPRGGKAAKDDGALRRLQQVRQRLPAGDRHPRRLPAGVHRLRRAASTPAPA